MKKLLQGRERTYIRIILELFLAVVLALGIEAAFNFQSFTNGFDPIGLEQRENNGRLIFTKNFEEPTYVKKLIIQGTFEQKVPYTVSLKTVNEFDVEETVRFQDKANNLLETAFSNINARITRIRVVFSDADLVSIDGVSVSNQVQFNKYRILFFSFVLFFALMILFEKSFLKRRIELVYLVASLGVGMFTILASGPQAITWDEEAHFRLAYLGSFGSTVTWDPAALSNCSRVPIELNTGEERVLLDRYMDQLSENGEELPAEPNTGIGVKNRMIYLPMSVMLKLGRMLDLPFSWQYALGRIGNLLCCVLINFLAISLVKQKKVLLTAMALMPTAIFQGCMYTYDGIIFSCLTLGTVLCYRFTMSEERKIQPWHLFLPLALFGVGSMAKPVYLPFVLFLIPMIRKIFADATGKEKRIYQISIGAVCVGGVIAAAVYLAPLLSSALNGLGGYAGDLRGGETDVAAQLATIFQHPIEFIKLLFREITAGDNLRNFGDESLNRFMASNLMFLNLYVLGNLTDVWSFVLLPLLGFLFLLSPDYERIPLNIKGMRWISAAVVILSVILIWVSMYLYFTPVGMSEIEGVQARYYLPFIMPVAYLLWNRRLRLKITEERYTQIAMGVTLVLTAVCFYQGVIVGRVA